MVHLWQLIKDYDIDNDHGGAFYFMAGRLYATFGIRILDEIY
jgi:hypothetical protein